MITKQIALVLALAASSHAVELTPDNYAEVTDGKTVFLKVWYKEKMMIMFVLQRIHYSYSYISNL